MNAVFEFAERNEVVREAFADWLTPVPLDSERAKHARRRAARKADEANRHVSSQSIDRAVVQHLDAFEGGTLDAWWRLNQALAAGSDGDELESDLTRLPAWDRAPEDIRSRIIAAAAVYLHRWDADPDSWFGTDTLHRPAFAGYRALRLLAACQPKALEHLANATWERWMAIIVHYPRSSGLGNEAPDDLVAATAASRTPQTMSKWVLQAIDAQNATGQGHLFVLSQLRAANCSELLHALAGKVGDAQLTARARADLVAYLLEADPDLGLAAAAQFVSVEAAAANSEAAILVASMALAHAPGKAWPVLEPLFVTSPDVGLSIMDNVADGEHADLGAQLNDESLTRLVEWLFTHIAPACDPAPRAGAHWVSPRESSRLYATASFKSWPSAALTKP